MWEDVEEKGQGIQTPAPQSESNKMLTSETPETVTTTSNKDKHQKRDAVPAPAIGAPNEEAKEGSNADSMPEGAVEEPLSEGNEEIPSIPNAYFQPARILMNPRCVTTYAGVSHSQLALDLFGDQDEDENDTSGYDKKGGKYVLDDWDGAPSSFVCQEQR